MKPCLECGRHLRRAERMCPFCGAVTRDTSTPWFALLSLASVLGGCTDGPSTMTADDGSNDDMGDSSTSLSGTSLSGTGQLPMSTGAFETTSVDDDATTADETVGGGFIYGSPDGGPSPFECDIFDQDCPDGEKCTAWGSSGGAWNATRCVPVVDNPGQPGDECTVEGSAVSGIDDCDIGSMCWNVDGETNMGRCVALCIGDAANPMCEDPDDFCSITNDGSLVLCLPTCDPVLQDCNEGEGCYPVSDSFICSPDASGEMGAYGDPCEFINVCDPGLACLNPETVPGCAGAIGCCTEYCDLTDLAGNDQCSGVMQGQECTAWFEEGEGPPEYDAVGVCAVPI